MESKPDPISLGTLIRDGDKVGIIYREIKQGTWTEQPLFNWKTNFEIYSTDQEECDMLNKAAVFTEAYGATVCMVEQAAQEDASPSRREKSHLSKYKNIRL